ncbi:glyoxalase [Chitinophaga agrisoli]|uniref:Glyoxalase n=1 Tax=Chitinophaga agrisoli TaxID=2607653 RepID=A0A5B2VZK9_9BACT|nr:VOC family protein [Chitinophaga agrisoli]KAA2243577.1 glyoxalase [Chitinophaga agrisoli]
MNQFTNRSMPDCTIIPVLAYKDVEAAIDWLCNTFGFTERWRVGNHRAQLAFGGGGIALSGQEAGGEKDRHAIMVRVLDLNGHYEHVKQQGANILAAPADFPYGERQYSVADLEGHHWTFSQSIADVAPEDWGGVSPAR